MTSKPITRNNIIHGGVRNGKIDNKMFKYLYFGQMLAACRLDPTVEEYQLCVDTFPYFFKMYLEQGHV